MSKRRLVATVHLGGNLNYYQNQRPTMIMKSSMNFTKRMISGAIISLINFRLDSILLPEVFWP